MCGTQVARLAANSFEASFFLGSPGPGGEARRAALLAEVAALAARAMEEEKAEKRRQ